MATSSAVAPRTAARRAGPPSVSDAPSMPSPAAAQVAEPAKTKGISRWPSCQAGTAVFETRTAVYDATAGPATAAAAVATTPTGRTLPVTEVAAATNAAGA